MSKKKRLLFLKKRKLLIFHLLRQTPILYRKKLNELKVRNSFRDKTSRRGGQPTIDTQMLMRKQTPSSLDSGLLDPTIFTLITRADPQLILKSTTISAMLVWASRSEQLSNKSKLNNNQSMKKLSKLVCTSYSRTAYPSPRLQSKSIGKSLCKRMSSREPNLIT